MDRDSGTAINHYWYASHYDQWVWHKPFKQPVTVAAGGQHTLTLWAREDRMDVDKVMLLSVGSAAPSGEGPAESARVPSTGGLQGDGLGVECAPFVSFGFCTDSPDVWLRKYPGTDHIFFKYKTEAIVRAHRRLGFTCVDNGYGIYWRCQPPKPAITTLPEPVSIPTEQYVYFHTDALGSPVAAFNAKGEICWVESYAPYGEKLDNEDKEAEPATGCGLLGTDVGYTGHVQDGSGLVYAQQRYYDPEIGRFMSTDPIKPSAGASNMFGRYHYANNSPYNFTDPTGMEPGPEDGEEYDDFVEANYSGGKGYSYESASNGADTNPNHSIGDHGLSEFDRRISLTLFTGHAGQGRHLSYKEAMWWSLNTRGQTLVVDGRVITPIKIPFTDSFIALPVPLDDLKVHGHIDVSPANERIYDGMYDYDEFTQKYSGGIIDEVKTDWRNYLNYEAIIEHGPNARPFEIEYRYEDSYFQ